METVPFDFCQRVLATRKCCGISDEHNCRNPLFAAQIWIQPETKQVRSFYIGVVKGEWKYGFRNRKEPNESPTMEELKEVPQLKNLRIGCIDGMLKHDVVDLEKLLNFVSFLSNEPFLYLYEFTPNDCDSPEWKTVLKWLAERWFSSISVRTLKPTHYPIVEKQFSRRTPPLIYVNDCGECAEVLERRLVSGDLRRFQTTDRSKFSSTVFERIISNFLEAPQSYTKDHLDIRAYFEESAEKVLQAAVQKKFCSFKEFPICEHVYVLCRYRFSKKAAVLLVDKLFNGRWKLRTCEKGSLWNLNPSCWEPQCTANRANRQRIH